MFRTLLIANRGEIACRIARTARRLGITTVAVYSAADADALHVKAADRAIMIGAPPARDSYLNIPRIIEAARRSGADAIHPGYGFLSENPDIRRSLRTGGHCLRRAAGIGDARHGIEVRGQDAHGEIRRAAAARLSRRAPGCPFLADQANRIGYPLMIKAVSGGGGRGMRVVSHAGEFSSALDAARQEAASAFGDDRVLIERYLAHPRHIEVQVFADRHGNVVHLFERDCSVQRRHQKVIEEAPAPGLDDDRRAAMGRAAVAAARAVGYEGAGTVEFIANEEDSSSSR